MKNGFGMVFGILGVVLLVVAGLAARGSSTTATAQEGIDDLRVMTYNIKHGQGNDDCEEEDRGEGTPPASQCAVDLERTADVIASLEPDIVAIQEVDRSWARSGNVDQPTELVEALDMNACFGANLDHGPDQHADEPHEYGTLILSTFAIESCNNTFLPTDDGWEQRGLLEVRLDIDGIGEVAILNTHLQAGRAGDEEGATRQRTEQADAIAERIAEIDVPVILMGDFNAEPDDEELTSLRDSELGLQDAWQVAGEEGSDGNTSPAAPDEDPERRIDAIFVSSDFEVTSAEVPFTEETRIASDHLPVVADLAGEDELAATPVNDDTATPEPTSVDEESSTEPALDLSPTEAVEETPPVTTAVPVETAAPPTDVPAPPVEPTLEPEPTAAPPVDSQPPAPPRRATTEPANEATSEPAD